MIETSKKIITKLQNFLRNAQKNIDKYRQKKSDFTRNRKLPFKILCKFLSKLLKKAYKQNLMIFLKIKKLVQNQPFVRLEKN